MKLGKLEGFRVHISQDQAPEFELAIRRSLSVPRPGLGQAPTPGQTLTEPHRLTVNGTACLPGPSPSLCTEVAGGQAGRQRRENADGDKQAEIYDESDSAPPDSLYNSGRDRDQPAGAAGAGRGQMARCRLVACTRHNGDDGGGVAHPLTSIRSVLVLDSTICAPPTCERNPLGAGHEK